MNFWSSASQKTHQILTLALMQFVNYSKIKSDSVETMASVPHSNMQMSLWGKGSGWRHCSADSAAFHTLRPQMHVVHKYNWEATEDRRCARAKLKRITLSLVSEQFRMPLISWISCHPTSHYYKTISSRMSSLRSEWIRGEIYYITRRRIWWVFNAALDHPLRIVHY